VYTCGEGKGKPSLVWGGEGEAKFSVCACGEGKGKPSLVFFLCVCVWGGEGEAKFSVGIRRGSQV
jgi:hypothetical protein